MRNRLAITLAAALAIAAGILVTTHASASDQSGSEPPPPGPPPGMHGPGGPGGPGGILNPRIAREINLTEAQQKQIQALLDAHRAAVEPLHEKLRQNHDAVREATASGQFDEARVRALIAASEPTRTDLMVAEVRLRTQIDKVLTPEQRARLDQVHEDMRKRGRGRPGFRPGPK